MDRKKLLIEYSNCLNDPSYVIEHYYQTFDKTREGYVPFVLFRRQKELIEAYEKYRYNLVLKYRQAGITTVTAAYAAVKTVTANADNPEKILILANKQETAIEFLNKIVEFIKQSPTFLLTNVGDFNKDGKIEFPKGAQKHMRFKNKSEIKAVATSKDALRGYAPTIMILDEAAFIEGGQELWSACLASVSTGGKVFLISTPNGQDEIYYETYEGSVNGINKFHITHIRWWEDPRYNKGLKMIKTEDMVNYIQKPQADKSEEILDNIIKNEDRLVDQELKAYIENLIREGYRPHSSWYEHMCRDMNLNKRMINQELECAFNGSGDNVIESAVLDKQLATNIIEPIIKDKRWDSLLWIWKLPEANHRYIAALDVSRGDSEDSTGFTIIDFDTFEQVLEFHGKVPPDLAAQIVDQYSRMYNALTTFDITGGMGIAATNKLKELNFPGKLYHYDDDDDLTLFYGADNDKIPGINFAKQNRRVQIVEALERAISREGFKMRSVRLHNELKKFVYKNGKPDHMKGSHDDLIMALGMCLFVANNSFRKLSESVNSTKAMIDSWKVNTNNIQTTSNTMLQEATKLVTENNYGQNNDIYGNNNDTMKNTLEFSWLFGNIKKK
jgi:hypothetical protein